MDIKFTALSLSSALDRHGSTKHDGLQIESRNGKVTSSIIGCFLTQTVVSIKIKVWPVHQLLEEDQAASKHLWFEQLGSGCQWGAGGSGFQNGTGHLYAHAGISGHNRCASWLAAEQGPQSWHWLSGQHPLSAWLHPLWNAHNRTSILFLFSALEPSDRKKNSKIYIIFQAKCKC